MCVHVRASVRVDVDVCGMMLAVCGCGRVEMCNCVHHCVLCIHSVWCMYALSDAHKVEGIGVCMRGVYCDGAICVFLCACAGLLCGMTYFPDLGLH